MPDVICYKKKYSCVLREIAADLYMIEYQITIENLFFLFKIIFKNTNVRSYSEIAQASPKPSYVDVPLPSSSIMIREFSDADYKQTKRI